MTIPPTIEFTDESQAWSVNAGFYGVLFSTEDRDVTAYVSTWHATEAEAQTVASRHEAIVEGLEAHAPANRHGTRRFRLFIALQPDGSLRVQEYDFQAFLFDVPAPAAAYAEKPARKPQKKD